MFKYVLHTVTRLPQPLFSKEVAALHLPRTHIKYGGKTGGTHFLRAMSMNHRDGKKELRLMELMMNKLYQRPKKKNPIRGTARNLLVKHNKSML